MKTKNIVPEVGMGATYCINSDCYPYTIVEIINDKTIICQQDRHFPDDSDGKYDYYSNQKYTYKSNLDAPKTIFTLRKNGVWIKKGEKIRNFGYISIGHRHCYQDPSF
jgi:hypothetical protein